MKTVFTNDQCLHVYAQQTQDEGKTSNGNIFFDKRVIYSYGYHFPMAVFIDNNTIIINDDSYSISTSQHQGVLRSAVSHIQNKIYVNTDIIKIIVDCVKYNNKMKLIKYDKDKLEKNALNSVDDHIRSAAKRRAPHLILEDLNHAKNDLKTVYSVLALFNRKPSVKIKNKLNSLENDTSNNDLIEQAKTKLKKIKETITHSANKELKKWRKGDINSISYKHRDFVDTELRIHNDNELITSEGAVFPIEQAKRAFILVRKVKEKSNFNITPEQGNSDMFKLGYYKIDKITKQGHVRAGCHFVKWPAIEKMAIELNIYP